MASTVANAAQQSWKLQNNTELQREYIPLRSARQFFAVDASGSTAGSIMRHEHELVTKLVAGHFDDLAATWGSDCGDPTTDFSSIEWRANRGGTEPSQILGNPRALDAIGTSDLWYLLTDGEIWERDVGALCRKAMGTGVLNVPVVFVITGRKRQSPEDLNVSVGISFFANAPDCLVLFNEVPTGHVYVLAAKGCFAELASGNSNSAPDLESWTPLKKFLSGQEFAQQCCQANIQIPSAVSRPRLAGGAVNLGQEWERNNDNATVDLDLLFTAGGSLSLTDLEQLLAEEAFNNLSVACKTRSCIQDLRTFLIAQKIEEITLKLEDISGAREIITRLSHGGLDDAARRALQEQLREAHAGNRRHYQDALKDLRESGQDQEARKRNRLVNHALEQLADVEKAGYTADILTRRSNRARRAATVAPGGEVAISSLDLEAPNAFRGECRICCGESEVMSIALKVGADGAANTDNFALDFPLAAGRFDSNRDIISSQHVCFQCALAFEGRSLFREDLAAILPTLDCDGNNKKYIYEQLHVALTGGLRTGASGVCQLFMTILERTLKEKEWAGAGEEASQDPEVTQRREMLQWVLENLLTRTQCRETFNEQGKWVSYRQALVWAANDFRDQGVDSWAVGYPTSGFMQLISFGQRVGAFDEQTVRDFRLAKVMHSVASAYLALLFKNMQNSDHSWKQPALELVYADFNTTLVPTDKRGPASLVNSPAAFWPRLSRFLPTDTELLANWSAHDRARALGRVQLLCFWLAYHQRDHARAKTFFQRLRAHQPLSHPVLDCSRESAPLAPSLTHPLLLSIFRGASAADQAFHARHTGLAPFATPFGPSVLRCCFPACAAPFAERGELPSERWTERQKDALRQARAAHLVRAFTVDGADGRAFAQTGLPAVTPTPAPPASTHCNLHVSVARVWARMEVGQRMVVAGGDADAFVGLVREEICKGRRGDVFQEGLDAKVREVLPSFLEALRVALRVEGRDEGDVAAYEHDWDKNKLEAKARYEMQVSGLMEME